MILDEGRSCRGGDPMGPEMHRPWPGDRIMFLAPEVAGAACGASQIDSPPQLKPSSSAVAQPSDLPPRVGDFRPCPRAAHRGHTRLEGARSEGEFFGPERLPNSRARQV